jgi:predicted NAD-dependent protein-ADP-ribosyltransferase YbiA (DUF1768 family)
MAAKTDDLVVRAAIAAAATDVAAKKIAATAVTRADWDQTRIKTMYKVNRAKLHQHPEVMAALKATGHRMLVLDTKDTFWGVVDGIGSNHFGGVWMKLRTQV